MARKRLVDGFRSLVGGVNSDIDPMMLAANQVAWAENTTFRGSMATCRPAWQRINIKFPSDGALTFTAFNSLFFQGAAFYTPFSGPPLICCQVRGRQFVIKVSDDMEIHDITIDGDENTSTHPMTWWCQAEDWMILQDGLNAPLAILPGGMRRLDGANQEVPAGTAMAYSNGRLWVTLPDRRTFVAGDLTGSSSGSATYQFRDAVLKFTENTFLAEGGAFSMPTTLGKINAMREIASMDTALGEGPLQVFGELGAISVNAPTDRTAWQNLSYPLISTTQVGFGAKSQDSTVNVNADIFFRSNDGIRSYFMASRTASEDWFQRPISANVSRVLVNDSDALLDCASAVYFDNRLLMTCQPRMQENEVHFLGLVALDFNPISSFGSTASPAWEGIWTGLKILKIIKGTVNGVERCFAFVRGDSQLELWELTKNGKFDNDLTSDERITWKIETKAHNFSDLGLKQLDAGKLFHDRITGQVDFALQLRPDQYPCWYDWGTISQCATYTTCTVPAACGLLTEKKMQYRVATPFGAPPETCDTSGNKPAKYAYDWQVKLTITGYCRLRMLKLFAYPFPEDTYGECQTDQDCVTIECCESD